MSLLKMRVFTNFLDKYFLLSMYLVSIQSVLDSPSGKPKKFLLLRNIKLLERGQFNQQSKCSEGMFVVGIRKKTLKEVGAIREIVTAVEVTCSDKIRSETRKFIHVIGKGGSWGDYLECPIGFGVGLTVKIVYTHPEAMIRKVGDITLHCYSVSRTDMINSLFHKRNDEKSGFSYTLAQFCVGNEAITEINTMASLEIQFYQGENIKLRKIDIDCRRMDNSPASHCTFSMKWEKIPIQNCRYPLKMEGNSSYKVNCSFDAHIGVDYNRNIRNLKNILTSYYLADRYISPHIRYILMVNLMEAQRTSKFSNEVDPSISTLIYENNWQEDQSLKVNISQIFHPPEFMKYFMGEPKMIINNTLFDLLNEEIAEQLVGTCGVYVFRFPKFNTRHSVYFKTVINNFPTKINFAN